MTPVHRYAIATAEREVAAITRAVTERFGVSLIQLVSRRRGAQEARPRQVAMALCYELTPLSYPQIGKIYGRDHTTVMHAVVRVSERCRADPAFRADVDAIRAALKAG